MDKTGDTPEVQTVWKAISLTYVEYPKGDFLGCLLAWASLAPFILLVSFLSQILLRRDLHTIFFFIGFFINESVNMILKYTIKENRPVVGRPHLHNEYGMPSSHSQFMWFFATYIALFMFLRLYRNHSIIDDLWKIVCAALAVLLAICVSWSRVYLLYHTISQVICGAIVGSLISGLWFATVVLLISPVFPLFANCGLGEFLMLRDSTVIPHVLWFEYTCSRSEARSRQRKMSSRKSQ